MSTDHSQPENDAQPETPGEDVAIDSENLGSDVETLAARLGKQPQRSCLRIVLLLTAFLIIASIIAVVWSSNLPGQTDEEKQRIRQVEIKAQTKPDAVKPGDPNSPGEHVVDQLPSRAEQFPDSICNILDTAPPGTTDHPLDTPLVVAQMGLNHIRKNIADYTATLIKRERVNGKLLPQEYMHVKIRTQKRVGQEITQPLSVYLKFLAPNSMAGRETIWVRGRNNNKLVAHEAGLLGFLKVKLDPDGSLAMKGNRYPITEIGMETLALRMLEKGQRDLKYDECIVVVDRNVTIDNRPCTKIRIEHPVRRGYFEFHIAEIFIDEQYNVPVRYAAYVWPEVENGEPQLEEEYTYQDLVINPGLPDAAFDPDNPEYQFP